MIKNPVTYFLNLIQENHASPNFWMSEEYIRLSELEWVEENGHQGFKDDEGKWFFPPYNPTAQRFIWIPDSVVVGFQDDMCYDDRKFWDYEFIYDPKEFLNLSGGKWKVFRKNIKKHQDKPWEYKKIWGDEKREEVIELFLKWSEGKTLFDPETFTNFVLHGVHRFGLFMHGDLVGVNIADKNFKYINYRICFDTGEEFLNEFLRWKFYTSDWVQRQDKLVNDGGCLGSEGLKRFKMKLRPIEIKDVYTGVEG